MYCDDGMITTNVPTDAVTTCKDLKYTSESVIPGLYTDGTSQW